MNDLLKKSENTITIVVLVLILVALLAIVLSGCEAIRTSSMDAREVHSDCTLTMPDGTRMQCKHTLEKDVGAKDDGVSVVLPAPAAGQ